MLPDDNNHSDCGDLCHIGNKVGKGIKIYQKIEYAEKSAWVIEVNKEKYKAVIMVKASSKFMRRCKCLESEYAYIIRGVNFLNRFYNVLIYRILYKKCDN